jgi:PKHD-type hydroxylase
MLLHLPQVLTAAELQQIRQILANAPWTDGRVTTGAQSATVKNNQQTPETAPATEQARQIVATALSRNSMFVAGVLPKTVYPPNFNRYTGAANAFGSHIDNAVRTHAHTGRHVRTDISCTLFLSDPASYDGGELVVQHSFGEQRIKLAAGDAVFYPGSSVHRVEPVTRGERLASFFWVESMVRSDEQRQLIYELDMAIMALRQKSGESAEAVRLTGVYHNLLRMWADV